MTRPIHGRRARRAQWMDDALRLEMVRWTYGDGVVYEHVTAAILRARSAAKRARRLAARRAA